MNLPSFGVKNPVPINLMMAGFIIAGVMASFSLRRQFFPDMEWDSIAISMSFPGASPEEIEESIWMPIKQYLADDRVSLFNKRIVEDSVKSKGLSLEIIDGFRSPEQQEAFMPVF